MKTVNINVMFAGTVMVKVPDYLTDEDAKLLAEKIVLSRVIATTDNVDAPDEDAFNDYKESCSNKKTASKAWDSTQVEGISGEWFTPEV